MGRYLLDTNAVIDFFNGSLLPSGQRLLLSVAPVISVITQIELFSSSKTTPGELARLEKFVRLATLYDTLSPAIVAHTIAIRQQRKIKTPDAIIAATALAHGCALITRNQADFKQIAGLQLIDPHA